MALISWTDGEIIRAIRSGVSKDGRALFPYMPYPNYKKMTDEDVFSIVAYIRALQPRLINFPQKTELIFPVNHAVKTLPAPAEPASINAEDSLSYGRYLTTIASCADCHTPMNDRGEFLPGMDYAGGQEFAFDNLGMGLPRVRTANITPDTETGIGKWSREEFIGRFKGYDKPEARNIRVRRGDMNTPMPWTLYAGMTEKDLGAIYDYLRTVKPVRNVIVKFDPLPGGIQEVSAK